MMTYLFVLGIAVAFLIILSIFLIFPCLKEKIQKFNRSLNIQWALDVIEKFPKEENMERLSTNLEEWIAEVVDEDDSDQIRLWAKQVAKGKLTEEEFGERVKEIK